MMGRTIGARVEARCFQSSGGADPGGMARPPLCIWSAFKSSSRESGHGSVRQQAVCGCAASRQNTAVKCLRMASCSAWGERSLPSEVLMCMRSRGPLGDSFRTWKYSLCMSPTLAAASAASSSSRMAALRFARPRLRSSRCALWNRACARRIAQVFCSRVKAGFQVLADLNCR